MSQYEYLPGHNSTNAKQTKMDLCFALLNYKAKTMSMTRMLLNGMTQLP